MFPEGMYSVGMLKENNERLVHDGKILLWSLVLLTKVQILWSLVLAD